MNTEQYQKAKDIFQSALDLDPKDRLDFLRSKCGGDDDLQEGVERLLAAHDTDFLEVAAAEEFAEIVDPDPERAGEQIGHYNVVRKIGSGGMGDVYLAEDVKLGRKVAIKILPQAYVTNQDRLRRFQIEARAASSLNHPNIITIHEVGEHDGTHFIATEYVDGETLRHRFHREPFSIGEGLDFAIQLAAAVVAAHDAGITHRDLKPENIMVRRDRIVKVLDFGLAKQWNAAVPFGQFGSINDEPTVQILNTEPGMVMGTVQYMSPEQTRGHVTDTRSDIWSLGCVLYEMFSGRPPFGGDSSADVIAEIVKTRPPAISQFNSGVPERLEEIVAKCLEKDTEDRYQTARDLLNDLKTLKRKLDLTDEATPSDTGVALKPGLSVTAPNLINTKRGPKDLTTVRGREYFWYGIRAHRLLSFWIGLLVISLLVGTAFLVRKYWRGPNEVRIEYARKIRLAAQALEGSNLEQAEQLLNELKPEIGEADMRGFEWGYLSRLVAERRSTQPIALPHDGGLESAAFSPDGSILATGGEDSLIHLWDVATGERVKTLSGHTAVVWSVEFSPDGRRLLSGSADQTARIWDVESAKIRSVIGGESDRVANPRFSKDGKTVFASDADSIRSWDTESARESSRRIKTDQDKVMFAISPDGRSFAYRFGVASIKLIDPSSGRQQTTLRGHGGIVTDIKFSSDSKYVLTGSVDGTARLWNAATGDNVRTFTGHKNGVYDVAFSPDGKTVATSSHDKTIKIWNREKGYVSQTLKGHLDRVQSLAFSPDGRKIASGGGSDDRGAKLWTVPPNEPRGILRGHTRSVNSLTFSMDNKRLVSTDEGGETRFWSVGDEREEQVLKIGRNPVFSPDGTTLAAIDGKKLRFWDPVTGRIRQSVDLPRTGGDIVYSPKGDLIATNQLFEDGMVRLWRISSGDELCSLTAHKGGAWLISFAGDGERFITSSLDDNSLIEWETATCSRLSEFVGPPAARYAAIRMGNGRVVALEIMANLRSLKMVNTKDGSEIASFVGHDGELSGAHFSPDGKRFATCSKDGTIKLWDTVSGEELLKLDLMASEIESITFSPDGRILAAAPADGSVRLFRSEVDR
jgi:eukaryotic-like serine/threonine-protein kinase